MPKKGTPEYSEWLRKFRLKRRKKPEKITKKVSSISEIIIEKPQKVSEKVKDFIEQKKEKEEYHSHGIIAERLLNDKTALAVDLFGKYPIIPIASSRVIETKPEIIDVQLAEEPDEEVSDEIWNSTEYVGSEKVDGARATIRFDKDINRITARRKKPTTEEAKNPEKQKLPSDYTNHIPHIRDLDVWDELGDTVLDTEAVASNPVMIGFNKKTNEEEWGDSLSSTMSILSPRMDPGEAIKKQNLYGRIIHKAFDIQRYKGKDIRDLPWEDRQKILDHVITILAKHTDDIKKVAIQKENESKLDFYNRVADAEGEGIVLAKRNAPYKAFSRNNLIKAKRNLEYTLQILDVLEGTGRNKGKAGSFVMGAIINGKLTPIVNLNVGSDDLRNSVWADPEKYVGKQIEVKAMQWTPTGNALRHARWKTPSMFREDKDTPDNVSSIVNKIRARRAGKEMNKAWELQGEQDFNGINIKIENRKGSVRRGKNQDGTEWKTKMIYPYGYISRTMGSDGDHLDAFIGPFESSKKVFIIHQKNPFNGRYDEDKVMLGFHNRKQAKNAYLKHYDSPKFYGPMIQMDLDEFKEKIYKKENKGKKLVKSEVVKNLFFNKELELYKGAEESFNKVYNKKEEILSVSLKDSKPISKKEIIKSMILKSRRGLRSLRDWRSYFKYNNGAKK